MHLMIIKKNVAKIQHSLIKRIYSVLLALLLILPITSCSTKSDKEKKKMRFLVKNQRILILKKKQENLLIKTLFLT